MVKINSLSNSLFVYNAQIEYPPKDFIQKVEKIHKDFLWEGTAKIAHHTIIGEYFNGGIKYKDLNDFIAALNAKFLRNLSMIDIPCSHKILPIKWINELFGIPITTVNAKQQYFQDFFYKKLNILDCTFKVPRKGLYRGHPFYFAALKDLEKVAENGPETLENILSVPIWFNKHLKTKFDPDISMAGFDFIKDLFPGNQPINGSDKLSDYKRRKLISILTEVPGHWKNKIMSAVPNYVTVLPNKKVYLNGQDLAVNLMSGSQVYNVLISNKIRLPAGILRWRDDIELNDDDIKLAFMFARNCSHSIIDYAFQYKINTRILPTNEYLHRYKVNESNLCSRCNSESDTVLHSLWACPTVVPYVDSVLEFLKSNCKSDEVLALNMKSYFFGTKSKGLNLILLELKKEIFYKKDLNLSTAAFCDYFFGKIRRIMIKEKHIMICNDNFDSYDTKWKEFTSVYDYHGPDYQIII